MKRTTSAAIATIRNNTKKIVLTVEFELAKTSINVKMKKEDSARRNAI